MAKNKKTHHRPGPGKPRGATYAQVLAHKAAVRRGLEQAARDATVQVQADTHTQRAMWLMVGSGGGYVAVRPKAETYQTTKSGKQYAVGYITNAIEGGYRHGGPRGGGKGYRYRPRYQTAAVPGRFFYEAARAHLAGMGQEEADRLVQLIVDGLEGNL